MNQELVLHMMCNGGTLYTSQSDDLIVKYGIEEVLTTYILFNMIRNYDKTDGVNEYEIECDTSIQGLVDSRSGIFCFWFGKNDLSLALSLDFPKTDEDELYKIVQKIKNNLKCLL